MARFYPPRVARRGTGARADAWARLTSARVRGGSVVSFARSKARTSLQEDEKRHRQPTAAPLEDMDPSRSN